MLFSDAGRGDDDEMVGQREGDGDDGRVMEQDLVEGSVATAAAAALASAATKAKVKPVLPLLVLCVFVFKCSCHMASICATSSSDISFDGVSTLNDFPLGCIEINCPPRLSDY